MNSQANTIIRKIPTDTSHVATSNDIPLIEPGLYHFRFNNFMPWITVRVFFSSVADTTTSVKFAGFKFEAAKLFKMGYWKSV